MKICRIIPEIIIYKTKERMYKSLVKREDNRMNKNTVSVVGLSWGDEGKGKMCDVLAQDADIVVRYQGGNNAGHTVVVKGKTYKFHIMPSGAPLEKDMVIGNGCVIDPHVLLGEMGKLKENGKEINLKISSTAHVIFPFHRILDGLEEESKDDLAAGTTGRGIGPTYSDKAARWGLRMFDLINPDILKPKLERLYNLKIKMIQTYDPSYTPANDFNKLLDEYIGYGKELKPYVIDTAYYLNKAIDNGKRVVFEGAQGTLLGIDHGMYPFGTSSNANATGISAGTGVPPQKIGNIIGIIKAYTSRVGGGHLPTELENEIGKQIREQGNEYGTTTGRPRRVGWLDLFNIRYSIMINGVNYIVLTLLDALEGIDPLKVCVGYKMDGKSLESWPIQSELIEKCKPIYREFSGWESRSSEEWSSIAEQGYEALPEEIKKYVRFIEQELATPIGMLSIGPNRTDTIMLEKQYF